MVILENDPLSTTKLGRPPAGRTSGELRSSGTKPSKRLFSANYQRGPGSFERVLRGYTGPPPDSPLSGTLGVALAEMVETRIREALQGSIGLQPDPAACLDTANDVGP